MDAASINNTSLEEGHLRRKDERYVTAKFAVVFSSSVFWSQIAPSFRDIAKGTVPNKVVTQWHK